MKANNTSRKALLFTRLLPTLKEQSAYFSLAAVKRTLTAAEIELADDTLREYMSEAMANGCPYHPRPPKQSFGKEQKKPPARR